ncbi:MAG: hypothetical protein V1784_01835, partial [bacterium]
MRQSVLFWVLAVPVLAFGQPIEGPYVVLEAEEGARFYDLHLSSRPLGDADIFYVRYDSSGERYTEHAVFSFALGQVVAGPETILHTPGWQQQIGDVHAIGTDEWVALVYEDEPEFTNDIQRNRTWLLSGSDSLWVSTLLDTGQDHVWYTEQSDHSNTDFTLREREGGGFLASWIRNGCQDWFGFWEPDFSEQIVAYSEDIAEDWWRSRLFYCYTYGPTGVRVVSLSPDSTLALLLDYRGNSWGDGPFLLGFSPETEYPVATAVQCTLVCRDFRRTHGGSLLVFPGTPEWDPFVPRLVELDSAGGCTELPTFGVDRDPDAIAWHPDYGFAALLVHPARIM